MLSIENGLNALQKIVQKLDQAIVAGSVNAQLVDRVQAGLDKLDQRIKAEGFDATPQQRSWTYELQALIHFTRGEKKKAVLFAHEAAVMSPKPLLSQTGTKLAKVAQKQDKSAPEYFTVPTFRLLLLSFLTLGLYQVYWWYKNWKAIQAFTQTKQHPILSAIFYNICAYALFSRLRKDLSKSDRSFAAGWTALLYFIVNILSFGLLGLFILIAIQHKQNAIKLAAYGDKRVRRGTSVGEVIFVILGLACTGSLVFGIASTQLLNSPKTRHLNELSREYKKCDAELKARRPSINQNDEIQIADYNNDVNACEAVRSEYNSVLGQ